MTDNSIDPRQITYLPLGELVAHPRNPKAHDTDTIDSSIGRFGMLDLIVRDERTGQIVSGHGRHKVLTDMAKRGEQPPEGVKVDERQGWLVPVVTGWSSRTDTEAAAALIALNRTNELGGWVDDDLLDLLDELGSVDGGLDGVGYAEEDLEDLRQALTTHDEDDIDDLAQTWDEESGLAAQALVTIAINDAQVAAAWGAHLAAHDGNSDRALGALLQAGDGSDD